MNSLRWLILTLCFFWATALPAQLKSNVFETVYVNSSLSQSVEIYREDKLIATFKDSLSLKDFEPGRYTWVNKLNKTPHEHNETPYHDCEADTKLFLDVSGYRVIYQVNPPYDFDLEVAKSKQFDIPYQIQGKFDEQTIQLLQKDLYVSGVGIQAKAYFELSPKNTLSSIGTLKLHVSIDAYDNNYIQIDLPINEFQTYPFTLKLMGKNY
ncbi:MAG: fucose-binding lectin II [Chitinophagales bacterium]|jgi:hypothetical protein|nr:fucose-binding lectin II [Chitinophagales bacterium]